MEIIPSPPSSYFIPSATNLGPIGRNMSPITPNNAATQEEAAGNMLAAALGIDTSTGNNEGNTHSDNVVDTVVNGNTNELGPNENAGGAVAGNNDGNGTANAAPHAKYVSLYVGDLSTTVRDENLFEFFQKEDLKIVTVKVCRDMQTGESLGYGYANFLTHEDATLAIQKLNHKVLYTKPIRLMLSIRDSEARKNGIGNLFVKNLNLSCDDEKLDGLFSKVGKVLSAKVARNNDGSSRGYGFVQFESKEHADEAIQTFHDTVVDGKKLSVTHFIRKSDRHGSNPDGFTNLYMKNLDEDIDEELIRLKFSQFGVISSVMIAKDDKGISRGFGFVCFENPDSAKKAVDIMNGLLLGNKTLYVAKAQKKAEREQFLLSQKQERLKEWHMKTTEANIYVKNLREDVDDTALKNYFSQCGTINSAKVMRNDQGVSKGFGFVCYNSPEEALEAVTTLNRQFFYGKPLYVAQAERKEARKVKLQQQFSAAIAYTPPATAGGFVPVPTPYTSLYYAPRTNHVISQIPYNQGLMTQPFPFRPVAAGTIGTLWRPAGTYFPPSASLTPYQQVTSPVTPSTPRHRYYNRRNTPFSQRNFRYQPRSYHQNMRNMVMKYVPCGRFDENYSDPMPSREASTSRTSSMEVGESLCTVLDAAGTMDHDQQRLLLRDHLFPLVDKFKPEVGSKIIGHFMEMEKAEVVALVENPELVPAKMDDVLRLIHSSEDPSYNT